MQRSLPPLRLQRSPLVYVIGQVRFSAVVSIEQYVPAIQEELRHRGFPRFTRTQAQEISFGTVPPTFKTTETFEFQNKEGNAGVILAPTFVALHTNRYANYEEFEEQLRVCLEIIHRIVRLNLVERLGLRYVDLIRIQAGESLGDYLQEGLLGLDPEKLKVTKLTSRFDFVGQTEVGRLVVRCTTPEAGQFVPPDIGNNNRLKYDLGIKDSESLYLLDLDHFSEETTDFDVDAVLTGVGMLHDNLDLAFRNAVTNTALKKWGQEGA